MNFHLSYHFFSYLKFIYPHYICSRHSVLSRRNVTLPKSRFWKITASQLYDNKLTKFTCISEFSPKYFVTNGAFPSVRYQLIKFMGLIVIGCDALELSGPTFMISFFDRIPCLIANWALFLQTHLSSILRIDCFKFFFKKSHCFYSFLHQSAFNSESNVSLPRIWRNVEPHLVLIMLGSFPPGNGLKNPHSYWTPQKWKNSRKNLFVRLYARYNAINT